MLPLAICIALRIALRIAPPHGTVNAVYKTNSVAVLVFFIVLAIGVVAAYGLYTPGSIPVGSAAVVGVAIVAQRAGWFRVVQPLRVLGEGFG